MHPRLRVPWFSWACAISAWNLSGERRCVGGCGLCPVQSVCTAHVAVSSGRQRGFFEPVYREIPCKECSLAFCRRTLL